MVATSKVFSSSRPDIDIVWERRPLQAFADRPIEQMALEYDLIVIDHPHVGEAASKGLLVPLGGQGDGAALEQLAKNSVGPSHRSYEYNGNQWALAIDAAAPVAAWRPDLIEAPPQRWEDVLALADRDLVLWPIKPVDALMSFFTIGRNRGFAIACAGSLIEREEGLQVLADMRELARRLPAECLSMNPIEVFEWLSTRSDRAYCPFAYGYSNYSRRGFRPHEIRFSDIPDLAGQGPRGSCVGGTGIAVSSASKNVEAAAAYAFFVAAGSTQAGTFFDAGGQPAHNAAWIDPRVNAASADFFVNTRATLEQSWLRPRYAGYLDFQDFGGTAVNTFLRGDASPAQTLDALEHAYRRSRDH